MAGALGRSLDVIVRKGEGFFCMLGLVFVCYFYIAKFYIISIELRIVYYGEAILGRVCLL